MKGAAETENFERAQRAAKEFLGGEKILGISPLGAGHINDSFLLKTAEGDLVLQRINTAVFKDPADLMENIEKVTSHLKRKIAAAGGDCERETLSFFPARDGRLFWQDEDKNCFRLSKFIKNAVTFEEAETPEIFYESAAAFGRFLSMLGDFPAEELCETIPGFHDTAARFRRFREVLSEDKCGRAAEMQAEIDFVLRREHLSTVLGEMQSSGRLPLRVTHNDTKLNNVLLDKTTKKGLCVIDLDTVMPGLAVNDFGDSIRFGANAAAEDERDLDKVFLSTELFEAYAKGFIRGAGGVLTEEELFALPLGALVMTFECGMRFLTDYLEGDVYFKIDRPSHNKDRCRAQFKLLSDMEAKFDEMNGVIEKYITH